MATLAGGCHCGGLRVEFQTAQNISSLHPRACDCSFCRKHGAAYVSDPAGALSITENAAGLLADYRQGSNAARFLFCRRCGVLIAVVYEQDASTFGAVNSGCLDSADEFAESASASPQKLGAAEKTSRWQQLWVPDVVVTMFDDKTRKVP